LSGALEVRKRFVVLLVSAVVSLTLINCSSVFAGSLKAWGYNGYGQCNVPAGNNFTAIDIGDCHSIALKSDGSIVAWGDNSGGQCDIPAGNNFTAIAAGWYHNIALKSDGSLVAWGDNSYGQCDVPPGNDFVAIAAGWIHSLALKSDGSLVAWGNNWDGQCDVPADNNFKAVAGGRSHSLALKSDGSIVGWGDNDDGEATPPAGNNFIAVSAGWFHSLALKSDGSIVGWGWNNVGQATPPAGNNFMAIAAGLYHNLALKSDGSLVAWGFNGDGEATSPAGNNFIAVSAGWERSLAIYESGPSSAPPNNNYFLGLLQLLGFSNDPVNTATGNFIHQETDLSITTRGNSLEFSRFYNSKDSRVTSLGLGWTHSYNVILSEEPNRVNIRWGDGHTDYWDSNGSVYEPSTVGLYDKLVKNPDNTWKVTRKNLDKYNFDTSGRLISIADKNGNTISLSYLHPMDPNLVTAVSDTAGRTIALGYTGTMLTSVSDFDSPPRTVQYSYTGGRLTQVTDVMNHTIQYGYDPNGYLRTITDQRGITTVTNNYDSFGRVVEQWDGNSNRTTFAYDTPDVNKTTITDPNGNTTIHIHGTGYKLLYAIQDTLGHNVHFNYDEQGNRTSITDRNGNTTYFEYNNRGNVISKTAPDGGTTVFDYNDSNFPDLPTKITDALGNITQWQYDSNGNIILQVDPNDDERTFTYNIFGEKLTETDENGNTTTYIYDIDGLLTEVIDPNGNHSWYSYDGLWRLTHITDGRGSSAGDPAHTAITVYDKADRVNSIAGPITSESYQYDNVGNRTHLTNRRGYTTVYHYDNNKNLTRIERPAPGGQTQVTQYGYDKLNRKISMTDPNGNVTNYEYDSAGRLVKARNPENDETTYTYDAHGNILSVTDGNGVTTYYGYDSLNRKNHQYDELGNHWYWEYDKLGRLDKHTDAMGYKTNYEYDSLGRLIRVIDDANKVTQYKYDAVGNLEEIIDAAGITIEKRFYNTTNRLTRKEDGLGNAYKYSYDGAGNIISEKSPNNQTKTFVYDNENRLIQIHYPDSSQVIYSYNNNGNLTSMTDPTGTTSYVYDELDRLTSSTDSFNKQVQYGYDITGNRTSITYPADSNNPARTVVYTYDKANRLDTISDWAGRIWDYKVDRAGRITDVNFPNGIKELLSYDTAGRLSGLVYKTSGDTNLINYSYIRNGQGEPIDISESGALEPVLNLPLKENYSYDNDNRLIETTRPVTYGYDNNGNMTSRVTGGVTTTFTYDFENRMTLQTTGGSTVQHIYDGRGNRIARNNNGSVTRFVLDRGRGMSHILCETNGSGNIIAYYIHGPQIVGRIGTDGSQRYYHTDHIGNVVALTNESQAITDRFAYTPFGELAGREGTTANSFTYVGGLGVMAEAGNLYFMRARFYDSMTGRFVSKDPMFGNLGYPSSHLKYVYSVSNPIVLFDPRGLIPERSNDIQDFTLRLVFAVSLTAKGDSSMRFLNPFSLLTSSGSVDSQTVYPLIRKEDNPAQRASETLEGLGKIYDIQGEISDIFTILGYNTGIGAFDKAANVLSLGGAATYLSFASTPLQVGSFYSGMAAGAMDTASEGVDAILNFAKTGNTTDAENWLNQMGYQ
jgi:RHS repeat-associated protein